MRIKHIYCYRCHAVFPFSHIVFECPICHYSLDVAYDYEEIEKEIRKEKNFKQKKPSHWKYWMFYPIQNKSKIVSLQEGSTPLIHSKKHSHLQLKFEGLNPTGSFKDRGTTIEVSRANELGIKNVAAASTGNMGASIAAYCSRAGIKSEIFIPSFTTKNKITQMKFHGAKLHIVKGDYDFALQKSKELRKKNNYYLMGDYPLRGEGEKSIGFEIADQLHWNSPDKIFVPIGNGTLMFGVWKAFKEMKTVGLIKKLPKMIGVQSSKCNPVFKAFQSNSEIPIIKNPNTIATAIACGNPVDGLEALKAIQQSHGDCLQVSEKEIINARKELALEGVFAEPSGAVSFAGFKQLKEKTHSICIITGHGLKDA